MKRFGVACALVLTFLSMALGGAGNASATELCKAAESECAAANLYGEGTALTLVSSEVLIQNEVINVKCDGTLKAETMADAGEPQPILITAIAFSSCNFGCTAVTSHLPFLGQLEQTAKDEGTLKFGDWSEGNPAIALRCFGFIDCTVGAKEISLLAKGGTPATFSASKVALTAESGTSCPGSPSLSATFKSKTPESLHIAKIVSRFCKVAPGANGICPVNERYAGGFTTTLLSATADIKTATQNAVVSCEEAPFTGANFNSLTGLGEISAMAFQTAGTICSSTLTGGPGVKVTISPIPAAVSVNLTKALNPYLTEVVGAVRKITLELKYMSAVVCQYGVTRALWRIVAFAPMKVKPRWLGTRLGANATCPVGVAIEDPEYEIKGAGGIDLWVGW